MIKYQKSLYLFILLPIGQQFRPFPELKELESSRRVELKVPFMWLLPSKMMVLKEHYVGLLRNPESVRLCLPWEEL